MYVSSILLKRIRLMSRVMLWCALCIGSFFSLFSIFKSSPVCIGSCVKFGGTTMDNCHILLFEPQQIVCDRLFFSKRWTAQACLQLYWAHLCPFWPLCVHTLTFCHQCWCLLPLPAASVAWRTIFGVNSLGNSAGWKPCYLLHLATQLIRED